MITVGLESSYPHLTPGRPCLVPLRFVRAPAFNVFRPRPHFDGPAYAMATAFARARARARAAAAIFEAAAFFWAEFGGLGGLGAGGLGGLGAGVN